MNGNPSRQPRSSSVARISGKLRTSTNSPGRQPVLELNSRRIARMAGPAIRSRGRAAKYGSPRSSRESRTIATRPPITTMADAAAIPNRMVATKPADNQIPQTGRKYGPSARNDTTRVAQARANRARAQQTARTVVPMKLRRWEVSCIGDKRRRFGWDKGVAKFQEGAVWKAMLCPFNEPYGLVQRQSVTLRKARQAFPPPPRPRFQLCGLVRNRETSLGVKVPIAGMPGSIQIRALPADQNSSHLRLMCANRILYCKIGYKQSQSGSRRPILQTWITRSFCLLPRCQFKYDIV